MNTIEKRNRWRVGDGGTCLWRFESKVYGVALKKEGKINSMKTDTSTGNLVHFEHGCDGSFSWFCNFHAAVALGGREPGFVLDLRLSLFPLGRPANSACMPDALLAAMDALRWISSCACLVKKSSSAS